MPPLVLITPSCTVISPGPTCFHPTRSFPLNNCFHSPVCACATVPKVIRNKTSKLRQVFMRGFSFGENYKPLEGGFRGLSEDVFTVPPGKQFDRCPQHGLHRRPCTNMNNGCENPPQYRFLALRRDSPGLQNLRPYEFRP